MTNISYTEQQRCAIETTGRSVLVSAAAGSGKTAVLVERCVYLTCDVPDHQRCDIDQLLVLTFTEAAAAQMRSRIVDAIRERANRRPDDRRLREQVMLVDAAQISTIHAFCLWLMRRWFNRLNLDPAATILDEHESTLMKKEVIDDLFNNLYARETTRAAGFSPRETPTYLLFHLQDLEDVGRVIDPTPSLKKINTGSDRPLSRRFIQLIDDYGLGEDRSIAEVVLKLYAFTTSLPDPDQWLTDADRAHSEHPQQATRFLFEKLGEELHCQIDHCTHMAQRLKSGHPIGHFYGEQIRRYAVQLEQWRSELPASTQDDRKSLESYETLRAKIAEFTFDRAQGPRLSKEVDPEIRAKRDQASAVWKDVKKRLFDQRLKKRFGLFSVDEWIGGLAQTAPYVHTLVELVIAFRKAYNAKKRALGVLDFSDLEQSAYTLLRSTGSADSRGLKPAAQDIARSLHRKFKHVLVDEFQDINPIQQEILKLVSHETDPDRPGNLFVVGDVKQSIYRFRLAEPAIFTDRFERFRCKDSNARQRDRGRAVPLQQNFRSRHELLDAVNHVFSRLMNKSTCGIEYDESARLQPGRTVGSTANRASQGLKSKTRRGGSKMRLGVPATQGSYVHLPVEVHLIEKGWTVARQRDPVGDEENSVDEPGDDQPQRGIPNFHDPSRWTPIEREAYVIGSRIRRWISEKTPLEPSRCRVDDPTYNEDQPMCYRDMVILLRATKINAERMAAMLNAMDIPAYADAGGSLFGALEVRDVLAVLQLLDNTQQDIPLAAVLRSGIMGDTLSEDDLVEIHVHAGGSRGKRSMVNQVSRGLKPAAQGEVPFHEVTRLYIHEGPDADLRGRLKLIFSRIRRYRENIRRRPLADVLWSLYEQQGYLAYVSGLPNGVQRRANLFKLHELARKFGTFRRQGLYRFLRFMESLEETKQDLGTAPSISESEDVVRIMSIHQAKGLEFPVVFVAGLGTKFNLGDRDGRMIFERRAKIGLRVIDTERMIEYPSVTHQLAAMEIEHAARAEELRILYVAMTRAKDRLILVGSKQNVQSITSSCGERQRFSLPSPSSQDVHTLTTRLNLTAANTFLDWLIPAILDAHVDAGREKILFAKGEGKDSLGQGGGQRFSLTEHGGKDHLCLPLFDIQCYTPEEMMGWQVEGPSDPLSTASRKAAARSQPLPGDEPYAPDDPEVERVLSRIDDVYPQLSVTSVRATVGAGEPPGVFLQGAFDFTRPGERLIVGSMTQPTSGYENTCGEQCSFAIPPSKYSTEPEDTPAQRGLLTHRILEHLDFRVAVDAHGLDQELQRITRAAGFSPREQASMMGIRGALLWFLSTPLAASIRKAGDAYRREFYYTARESPSYFDRSFDRSVETASNDFILVRGIVDGILLNDNGIEIVDFKTDAIGPDQVPDRVKRYRSQMDLYARAISQMWNKPVRHCWLVFLTARQIISVFEDTPRSAEKNETDPSERCSPQV